MKMNYPNDKIIVHFIRCHKAQLFQHFEEFLRKFTSIWRSEDAEKETISSS